MAALFFAESSMRRSLLFLLLLAACARTPDELATQTNPLSRTFKARLTNVHKVTSGDALEPQLSPDGKWVAFTGPQLRGIRVAQLDGGSIRVLTDEPGAGFRFAWSPDGSSIAYFTRETDGASRLMLVRRTGGSPELVHQTAPSAPLPLPRFTEEGELLYLDGPVLRSAGRVEPVSAALPGARVTAHSARTGELLFAGDLGVFAASQDGTEPRPLFEGRQFFDLSLSPDGATLLVRELRQDPGLWAVDLPSGRRTFLEGLDRGCVLPSGLLVTEKLEGDGLAFTGAELHASRADGSNEVRLADVPGTVPYRVHCAQKAERIAFGEAATNSVFVADVEVLR